MINEKETQKEKEKIQFLKKKTNRSFEKEIKIIDNISKNEITKKIKTIEELTEILSSCLNPYYICNNKIITLDNKTNIKEFLNNQEVNQIYQNIKNDDFKQLYINYYKDFIESEINNNSIINENKLFQLKNLFILLLNDISYNKNLKNILTNILTLLDFSKEEINKMLNNKIKKGNLLNYLKNKTLIYK